MICDLFISPILAFFAKMCDMKRSKPRMSKSSHTFQKNDHPETQNVQILQYIPKMALLMSTFSKCFVCFSILFLGSLGCAELWSIMCSSIISLGDCSVLAPLQPPMSVTWSRSPVHASKNLNQTE